MTSKKKEMLSIPKDSQHPGQAGWSKVVLYTGPEKQILVGGTASGRQRKDSIFHGMRAVSIHGYALQTL